MKATVSILLVLLVIGCNDASKEKGEETTSVYDSTSIDLPATADTTFVSDHGHSHADTILHSNNDNLHVDTVYTIPGDTNNVQPIQPIDSNQTAVDHTASQQNQKRSAILGYSYFRHMRQYETRNIYAYIMPVNKDSKISRLADSIITDLKILNSQVKPERKSDTASYFTKENIYYYKYLTITLNDPDKNFNIDTLGIHSRQLIDTAEQTSWQWAVTPKTSIKNTRMILKVVAEKENGMQKTIDTREIAIAIQLETNVWRELVTWLRNNPEKLLVLILIPLAAYFGRRVFERKKKDL